MKNKIIPIYECLINEEQDGIFAISFVECPATKTPMLAFSEEQKELKFSIVNEEQRRVIAVVMRADYPILREEDGNMFYVTFSKETLRQMAQKMLRTNSFNAINLEHTKTFIDGVEMVQLFIKNTEVGINPLGFEEVEEGSLFAEYKINNDELWQAIKEGKFCSVSLEGTFTLVEKVDNEPDKGDIINDLTDLLALLTNIK